MILIVQVLDSMIYFCCGELLASGRRDLLSDSLFESQPAILMPTILHRKIVKITIVRLLFWKNRL
jgi:hypothetical protein